MAQIGNLSIAFVKVRKKKGIQILQSIRTLLVRRSERSMRMAADNAAPALAARWLAEGRWRDEQAVAGAPKPGLWVEHDSPQWRTRVAY